MLNKELLLNGKVKLYNIIRGTVSNVSLSYSPQTDIKAGTRVNITVNANSGYQNPSVSVTKNDGTGNVTVSGSGSNRYFTMPKSDVTINASASLIPTYSVSGSASGGGISFSKTSSIRAGETVTVYLSPNSHYIFSSLTSSPSVSFSGSGNTRTFRMPSSNVRVTATFVATYTHIAILDSWKASSSSSRTSYGWRTLDGKPNEGSISPYIDNASMSCIGTSNVVNTLYTKGYAYCGRYDKNLYVHNQTTCPGLWDYTEMGKTVYLWLSNNPPPWI